MSHTMPVLVVVSSLAGFLGCGDTHGTTAAPVASFDFVTQTAEVDILWVIDNSPSMRELQAQLVYEFAELATPLTEGWNFRIGVTSTQPSPGGGLRTEPGPVQAVGCLDPPNELAYCGELDLDAPYLDGYYRDPSYPSDGLHADGVSYEFACLASVGDCGSSFEMGLAAARDAVGPATLSSTDADFVRDDAFLLVAFLTNEDDCSNDGDFVVTSDSECRDRRDELVPTRAIYDALVDAKGGDEAKVLIAGIIAPPGGCGGDAADGVRYRELIGHAGARGVEANVCADDFAAGLEDIGELLRDRLPARRHCLTEPPARCTEDDDCVPGVACITSEDTPGAGGLCADFDVTVEVDEDGGGEFEVLVGAGPIGDEPSADAEYRVDYDDVACPHGIAFEFAPGSRPPTGATVRVTYPAGT